MVEVLVIAVVSLLAFSLLLLWLYWPRRTPRPAPRMSPREAAHLWDLDTRTPQTKDPFWDDWTDRHGGGL
jgi:hypothetical protein